MVETQQRELEESTMPILSFWLSGARLMRLVAAHGLRIGCHGRCFNAGPGRVDGAAGAAEHGSLLMTFL